MIKKNSFKCSTKVRIWFLYLNVVFVVVLNALFHNNDYTLVDIYIIQR